MEEEKGVSFKRKIGSIGGSSFVLIPKELMEFSNLKEGDSVRMAGYKGKYGKYIALWLPNEEKEE